MDINNKLVLRVLNSPWANDIKTPVDLSNTDKFYPVYKSFDNNFIHLKGETINTATTKDNKLVINKVNGEDIEVDLSPIVNGDDTYTYPFDGYFYSYKDKNFMMDWPNVPNDPTDVDISEVLNYTTTTISEWACRIDASAVAYTFIDEAIAKIDELKAGFISKANDIYPRTAWYPTHLESTLERLLNDGNITSEEEADYRARWQASAQEAEAIADEIDRKITVMDDLKAFYIALQEEAQNSGCNGGI